MPWKQRSTSTTPLDRAVGTEAQRSRRIWAGSGWGAGRRLFRPVSVVRLEVRAVDWWWSRGRRGRQDGCVQACANTCSGLSEDARRTSRTCKSQWIVGCVQLSSLVQSRTRLRARGLGLPEPMRSALCVLLGVVGSWGSMHVELRSLPCRTRMVHWNAMRGIRMTFKGQR